MRGATYLRNFIFGVEDSLVSTVGLLSGVAIAGMPRESIFLTGVVLVFVEAFSMAAGSFLSETSAEEYAHNGSAKGTRSARAGAVMFASYFVAGFIPLFPYVAWERAAAFPLSILFSILALVLLGAVSGRMTGARVTKSALRMGIVGGIAIAVGAAVGLLLG